MNKQSVRQSTANPKHLEESQVAQLPTQAIDQLATALLKAAAERHSTERLLLYRLKQAAAEGRVAEVLSLIGELSGDAAPVTNP